MLKIDVEEAKQFENYNYRVIIKIRGHKIGGLTRMDTFIDIWIRGLPKYTQNYWFL